MNNYRIPEVAKKYTEHDMIQTHIDLPKFPDFRTRLLYTFLQRGSLGADSSELYPLVTSLAQMGLDTHDLISDSVEDQNGMLARARQLKVLAGDYFSSRFYQLLSQAGDTEMTKLLANAICEVNRLKMNFYTRMNTLKLSTEDYVQQTVNIRTQLFMVFSKWMDGLYLTHWPDILHGFTRCEVIVQEIDRSESVRDFHGGWAFWHIMQIGTKEEKRHLQVEEIDYARLRPILLKYNVKSQLLQMLDQQFQQVLEKIRQFESEKMINELFQIGEPFIRYLAMPKVMEER